MYDGGKAVDQEAPSAVEHKGVLAVNLGGHAAGATAHYSSYRCAILFLLHEQESYGPELAARLTDMGFDARLVASLDTVLASMEQDELIVSFDAADAGAALPRRVYGLTGRGRMRLSDTVPVLIRRCDALGGLVGRYLAMRQADNRRGGNGQEERRASAPW